MTASIKTTSFVPVNSIVKDTTEAINSTHSSYLENLIHFLHWVFSKDGQKYTLQVEKIINNYAAGSINITGKFGTLYLKDEIDSNILNQAIIDYQSELEHELFDAFKAYGEWFSSKKSAADAETAFFCETVSHSFVKDYIYPVVLNESTKIKLKSHLKQIGRWKWPHDSSKDRRDTDKKYTPELIKLMGSIEKFHAFTADQKRTAEENFKKTGDKDFLAEANAWEQVRNYYISLNKMDSCNVEIAEKLRKKCLELFR